jgi:transposase-like protein
MNAACPKCFERPKFSVLSRIVRHGSYSRTSDSRLVNRYRCLTCKVTFSNATHDPCFRQKKRQHNWSIYKDFCSNVSQRQIGRKLNIRQATVAKKLIFLANMFRVKLHELNQSLGIIHDLEFDDLETFEHSKCKPLSVLVTVAQKKRWIISLDVAQMPAKGRLAKKSLLKYGPRVDERRFVRRARFEKIRPFVSEQLTIRSDSNPHYGPDVAEFFPKATYDQFKGVRGAITGQGELKKTTWDPLFSVNHTCAMLRAHISRLIRKTWNTTKNRARLQDHLDIYAYYHNTVLLKPGA